MPSDKFREIFPASRRIKSRAEFEQAFNANRFGNKWFVIYTRKNEKGFSRLGMVVSKKIMPKAVSRNFSKRMIRELFRKKFPMEQSLDIVVRPRRQMIPENFAEGRQALALLLHAVQK